MINSIGVDSLLIPYLPHIRFIKHYRIKTMPGTSLQRQNLRLNFPQHKENVKKLYQAMHMRLKKLVVRHLAQDIYNCRLQLVYCSLSLMLLVIWGLMCYVIYLTLLVSWGLMYYVISKPSFTSFKISYLVSNKWNFHGHTF